MRVLVLALILAPPAFLGGQAAPPAASDYGKWESPGATALSPDGRWLAYGVNRVDERTELRLRHLQRDTTITLTMGSSPQFASSSRWLAYTVAVTPEERQKLERDKKPVRTSAGLVELATGNTIILAQASTFRFSPNGRYLAVRTVAADAAKRDAADLLVRDLAAGTTHTFGNIASFAWADGGALLAMTVETEGHAGNGVQLLNAATGRLTTLTSSHDRYRALSWRKGSTDLAVLRTQTTTGFRDTTHVIIAWKNPQGDAPRTQTLDPVSASGIPAGMRISEHRIPEWSKDGEVLYFGLRPRIEGTPPDTTAANRSKDKASDVQIWHARDVRPIPQQKAQEQADLRRVLLTAWRFDGNRVIALGTELHESVTLPDSGRYAIESETGNYAFGTMFGRPRRDVSVIDLRTGERKAALQGVRTTGGLSPRGSYIAWFREGAWWLHDNATGASRNLTAKHDVVFEDRDDDHPLDELAPHGFAGWSPDDRWLFVYDKYDLWRLAADGSRADRLTNGAPDHVVHRLIRLDPDAPRGVVDPAQVQYFSLHAERTRQNGYARLRPGQAPERLILADAAINRLIRADSAPVFAWTRERFDTPPAWYVGGADLKDGREVARLNPFHAQHAWGRAELVGFTNDSGKTLQGALYYPASYDPARKYPMIVNTYEIMSPALHNFQVPSERTYYNRTVWTHHGYFVFTPDIVFRAGDPGRSYLESLIPAVRSIIARGIVDSARIGLVGHSWGGYEATYAPTQTNLFATSIAGAPITNFLSFAGAFHWTPGMPEFDHWETGQARMAKPPWEDFEGHVRNSPAAFVHRLERPMLMMFGDADGTVDWHQGVEFYNFARRAGKENFVMLVYPGEDHGLRKKENQIDYHRRILEWFGHWLKGEPAAEWIRRGVTWEERKAVIQP